MPEIDLGPLSQLTPLGVLTTTALITFIDVIVAIALSVINRTFSLAYVAEWLVSHSAKRVTPIYALLVFGVGIPALEIPAIPALFALSVAGVVGYAGETVKSIQNSFSETPTDVADESSIPTA